MPSYIENYINFHTSYDPNVKRRGEQLFKRNQVLSAVHDEKKDYWTFKVMGTKLYTVGVKMRNDVVEHTSCTCPYEWGTLCKHTVAALLYLDNKKEDEKNNNIKQDAINDLQTTVFKKTVTPKRTKEPLLLPPGYENLTEEYIKYLRGGKIDFRWELNTFEVSDVSFVKDEITFPINYFYKPSVIVNIFKKNNSIYIETTEPTQVRAGSLKKSEAHALAIIAGSSNPDLLDEFFIDNFESRKKQVIEDFAIRNTDFDKYFEITFTRDEGLIVFKKPTAFGLLPSKKYTETYGLPSYRSVIEDMIGKSAPLELKNINERREAGFVISIITDDDDLFYDMPPGIKFYVITGEPDRKNIGNLKNIKRLSSSSNLSGLNLKLSDKQTEVVNIILDHEERWDNKYSLEEVRHILDLLTDEKHLYARDIYDTSHNIRKRDLMPVTLAKEPASFILEVFEEENFINGDIKFKVPGLSKKLSPQENPTIEMYGVYYHEGKIYKADDISILKVISEFGHFRMSKTLKDEFYETVIEPLSQKINIAIKDSSFKVDTIELDFSKKQIFLGEEGQYITITPQVVYGEKSVTLNSRSNIIEKNNGSISEYVRNYELEKDFINSLTLLHPEFDEQKENGFFFLHHEDFVKDMWFFNFFEHMQQNDVEVFGLKELKNFRYSPFKGKLSTSIKSGQDWFDVNVELSFGSENIRLNDIRKAVINKHRYIQLKDGSIGILPSEWLTKLEKYFRNGEVKGNNLKISSLRFSVIDDLFDNIDDEKIIKDLERKRKMLSRFKEIEKVNVPKEIKATLRDYQKEGLNWLGFLDKMQWGGILADDMGLGKTLQVLTFLLHKSSKDSPANLIVVPTTLLFNWQNEIDKFAPKVKALFHYGPERADNAEKFNDYDIVFTTYGILLRDIEILKDHKFNYVILDESQAIKNPASRRFKAASVLNANNRLALTGTPIENSTFDLYAQMSFVNPGIFGSVNQFRANYLNPIDKDNNEEVAAELQKIINPFVLRRTKEQVATELPPKVEDVIFCEMDAPQRKVYDAYRNEYRNKLINKIEKEGLGKSKFMVLEALTRLRQICDSPALLKDDRINVTDSVKIREIVKHITEKTSRHKILIFSQFVEMLSLLKEQLMNHNIEFEYLDGQSTQAQRETSVNNFQNNEELRVFLISLKAGGTGLNLTAADYVYIMDPWWNPAVENQAIDRCYRIGQDKHVFAYRMICKDTVEEKIMELQAKKKKIATDIVRTDEDIIKNISINDINNLFG